jgi:hypothetical protein
MDVIKILVNNGLERIWNEIRPALRLIMKAVWMASFGLRFDPRTAWI